MEFDRVVLKDGSTSKMIEYKGRSFDDVLTDVQSFIYIRGFDTARRLLKFILLRIGLPNVETFPRDDTPSAFMGGTGFGFAGRGHRFIANDEAGGMPGAPDRV
ncbi:MAG: hypothetical protein ACFFDR_14510 [Candidatus Thorarchaeota archaeon]